MKIKRKVSINLGRTQHYKANFLYQKIREKHGPTRKCPFYGGKKYLKFNKNSHNLLNPNLPNPNVPIEQFDFQLKKSGNNKWDLQSYCKVCYKAYRDARINNARSTWVNDKGTRMTDSEIREWYKKNVSAIMQCSVCKRDLPPESFSISRSMEKGLHNVCYECVVSLGASDREKIWLSDGHWNSWRKIVLNLRKSKNVQCAGWKRSVLSKHCKGKDSGKNMHADHIIPLRAGGIHDARNFQPLCSACNEKKSDQIDPLINIKKYKILICSRYQKSFADFDSIETIERKLKNAVENYISKLESKDLYLKSIIEKKRKVNGQWNPRRIYKKGLKWLDAIKRFRK